MTKAIFYSLLFITATGARAQQAQPQPTPPPPTLPPGLEQQQQLPPGLRRQPLPPGLQRRLLTNELGVVVTNQFGGFTNNLGFMTNEFGVVTNQFGAAFTNQFGVMTNAFGFGSNQFGFGTNRFGFGSNQFGFGSNAFGTNFPPTGFGTNRFFGTNTFGGTNQTGLQFQDQATSQFDRTLLVRMRAMVLPKLHTTAAWTPVHFELNNGAVTLVGFVVSAEQRQLALSTVQAVPGVVNVADNLQLVSQDMALTETDRPLLMQLRQAIPLQPVPTATMSGPLFFVVQQSMVTVVGVVPNVQEGERVIALVRQTPGVAQVSEALTIGAGVTAPTVTPSTRP
jgi:hypothetical protein